MISFPKAKINLGLRILRKREDGFHDIETVFYPVGLADALEFVEKGDKGKDDTLTVSGLDIGIQSNDNILFRVLEELRRRYPVPPLLIHLHKVIPAGGGLGGGSSDAACFIRAISKRYSLGLKDDEMRSIALRTGSDAPFFIDPVPSYATGRGEVLEPVNPVLKGYYLVLANEGTGVNTREAYRNCMPAPTAHKLKDLINRPLSEWKDSIFNDFEEFVFERQPLTGELKTAFYRSGALFSSMSGSGSTVFGIFDKPPDMKNSLIEKVIWQGYL